MTVASHNKRVIVHIIAELECDDVDSAQLCKLARTVCGGYGVGRAVINIVLTGDASMRVYHRRFLGSSKTTDVISFDLTGDGDTTKLYDIVINIQQARRQAASRGHAVVAETALYLVHGLLHQLGYDDDTPVHARRMHLHEDTICRQAGFGNVFKTHLKG